MCDPFDYLELETKYNELLEKFYRLSDECDDFKDEASRLEQKLIELEMYEEWRENCRKQTLQFRVFDRTWWKFFFYYVHIVLGKN
jgi:hypothetical protein